MDTRRHEAGFKDRTRVAAARETILEAVTPHGRTEAVPIREADGRVIAESIRARNPVPGYDRAAMDGYAVRARDTFGASDRSPVVLDRTSGAVGPNEAVRVHTGSDLPEGADAVVMIEQVETVADGDEIEAFDAVAEGDNVGAAGEDVAEGQHLYDPGHRLRPSDLGLLKSVGLRTVQVTERPDVAVIPTGEELVSEDPSPGEVIETNGLTVSRLAERWGGNARYRDIVTDDETLLREAIEAEIDDGADLVVTTGGSSVGERDLLPEVLSSIGEILVHGVALKPGHPVCLGVVDDTPVVCLPGYPVACIVNAVQFLRPALKRTGGAEIEPHPTQRAGLSRKVASEPGTRTFARVRLKETHEEASENADGSGSAPFEAIPTRASGSGVLSSVALADGWVVVPEAIEGLEAGTIVDVEIWEESQ
ncbi:gephyrin-like molybdotransferase Glp [Halopenitus sp. H-Gu1]|uniref:molybdopterin molybdotransferase MoeA n=1 Tax=Halopenitus sp. H-Gu1 TaxID=3242697 RepID=UPI00359EE995